MDDRGAIRTPYADGGICATSSSRHPSPIPAASPHARVKLSRSSAPSSSSCARASAAPSPLAYHGLFIGDLKTTPIPPDFMVCFPFSLTAPLCSRTGLVHADLTFRRSQRTRFPAMCPPPLFLRVFTSPSARSHRVVAPVVCRLPPRGQVIKSNEQQRRTLIPAYVRVTCEVTHPRASTRIQCAGECASVCMRITRPGRVVAG